MGAQRGAISLRQSYRPRAIGYHGVETVAGWTMKLYGISAHTSAPRAALLNATVEISAAVLPSPPQTGDRYGVGFAIAHDAADYCFALVNWWSGENEVHQRLLSAPLDRPAALRPHQSAAIGCVWELEVTDFERRAWMQHVLANPNGPDVEAYLTSHFEGRI